MLELIIAFALGYAIRWGQKNPLKVLAIWNIVHPPKQNTGVYSTFKFDPTVNSYKTVTTTYDPKYTSTQNPDAGLNGQ